MTRKWDRNHAARMARLRHLAAVILDDDPEPRHRAPSLGHGWRTSIPGSFPVTVTHIGEPRPDAEIKMIASILGLSPTSPSMRRLAIAVKADDDA